MFSLPIDEMPPSMRADAFMIGQQILASLDQSKQQRVAQEKAAKRMKVKLKRRIRKHSR